MICIILELHEFSDLKYPNFDPSHAFLSSIEAEITFMPKTAAIFFLGGGGVYGRPTLHDYQISFKSVQI